MTHAWNAKTWLNINYHSPHKNQNVRSLLIVPASQRKYHAKKFISHKDCLVTNYHYLPHSFLVGELDLSTTFPNLERVVIEGQGITRLVLTDCSNLKEIIANNNSIRTIDFPIQANKLKSIELNNNNILPRDLSCFAQYPQLESLYLGTDGEGLRQGRCNFWNGSLSYLRNLTGLIDLDINATDINQGLEDLPTEELLYFTFSSQGRKNAGVVQLQNLLNSFFADDCSINDDWAADTDLDNNVNKTEDIREWQWRLQQFQTQQVQQVDVRDNK